MISRRALLWLVPFWVTIHNIEELAGISGMLARLPDILPAWLLDRLPVGVFPPTYRQYVLMILIVTILPYVFALPGGARRPRGLRTKLLAGAQALMFLNVFSHLGLALLTWGYVPGLATALGFNLPFSLYFFWQGLKTGWIRDSDLGPFFITALFLHSVGLFGLLLLVAPVAAGIQW